MKNIVSYIAIFFGCFIASLQAHASDTDKLIKQAGCGTVHFGEPPWPGVELKTAAAAWILNSLGYDTKITHSQLGLTYQAISQGDLDVTLSQWFPSARNMFRPFGIEGSIDIVSSNLEGGTYTIAVPNYVYQAGVTSIKDLDKHKGRFGGKLYGIGAGTTGNDTIKRMIKDDYAGLGSWNLVASSQAAMLAEVKRKIDRKKWIAFLGWSPHPMNINFDIKYLSGGPEYWGPNKGNVIVKTVVKEGYAWACPNIGQFLDNYKWTVNQQSRGMNYIRNDHMKALEAGKKVIRKNPGILNKWLDNSGIYQTGGVMTANGKKNAKPVIRKALGLSN